MIDSLLETIRTNSIAQGGIVIALFSTACFWLRSVPIKLFQVVQRRYTSYIRLDHTQKPLEWMMLWLGETDYGQRTKHLTVCDKEGRLTVGSGRHIFWRDKSLVVINYVRETVRAQGVPIGREESVEVRVVPGNRKIIENILTEARAAFEARYENTTQVMMPQWGDWNVIDRIPRPTLDSVVLPAEQKEVVTKRLQRFVDNKETCERQGVPWRFGLLLHGPPGNGKTSLAKAIAGHMKYNICILSLNGVESDGDLLRICGVIPDNVVLLIEDIDAYNIDRDSDSKGITLSGLLNVIDGVTAKNGCVTIMTTNYPDKLDTALVRKGRTDLHLKLDSPTREQLVELFERFGHDYEGEAFENMAEAQDYLLNYEY